MAGYQQHQVNADTIVAHPANAQTALLPRDPTALGPRGCERKGVNRGPGLHVSCWCRSLIVAADRLAVPGKAGVERGKFPG